MAAVTRATARRSLVQWAIADVPALAVDAFRCGAGLVLIAYFVQLSRELLPLILSGAAAAVQPAPQAWLVIAGIALGLVGSAGIALGVLPRLCAALTYAACWMASGPVPASAYLDDEVMRSVALWLVLLPIGHTLSVSARARTGEFWQRWWLLDVPGLGVRALLFCYVLLTVGAQLQVARPVVWALSDPQRWLLSGLPLLAVLGRLPGSALPAAALHIALCGYFGYRLGLPFTAAALIVLVPLLYPVPLARRLPADRQALQPVSVSMAGVLALLFAGVTALQATAALLAVDAMSVTTARVLRQAGAALRPGAALASPPAAALLAVFDAQDKRVVALDPLFSGRRAQLMAASAGAARVVAASSGSIRGLRLWLADRVCASSDARGGPLSLRAGAEATSQLRFTCAAGVASLLPDDDGDEELSAIDGALARGFPAATAQTVGPEACGRCHPSQLEDFRRSRHAHSAAQGPNLAIAGNFDREPLVLPEGSIAPFRDAAGPGMRIGSQEHRVAIAIGSGRQQQAYARLTDEGGYELLPAVWSTARSEWVPLAVYYPETADPQQPTHGAPAERCFDCHGGQHRSLLDGGRLRTEISEAAVGCESCHGPGQSHVAAREQGQPDNYRGIERAAAACQRCHANHAPYRTTGEGGTTHEYALGLDDLSTRADGTAFLPAAQQAAGLALSACARRGGATCTSCHTGHGAAAAVAQDRCLGCHREQRDVSAQLAHSHHPAGSATCNDCHMPAAYVRDEPNSGYLLHDHSISIPRPREAREFGRRAACDSCHASEAPEWAIDALTRWGQNKALEVRPERVLLHKAKSGESVGAVPLLELAVSQSDGRTVAALLRMLANQRPDESVASKLGMFIERPEPEVRGAALAAAAIHAKERSAEWQARASGDAHPFVRMMGFELGLMAGKLSEAEKRQYLVDVLATSTHVPVEELLRLASVRAADGDPRKAQRLLERAVPLAPEDQRGTLRKRMQSLAEHPPQPR